MNDLNNIKKENDLQFTRYLLQLLRHQGGATLNRGAYHISTFENGFQVSMYDLLKIDLTLFNNDDEIIQFLHLMIKRAYEQKMNKILNIGLWIDCDMLYLDYSMNIKDKKTALKLAEDKKQLSIYDWSNKQVIYL